jgi:hypothetical protein
MHQGWFLNSEQMNRDIKKGGILKHANTTQTPETYQRKPGLVSFDYDTKQPLAQLSLSDDLSNCFHFDVQEINGSDKMTSLHIPILCLYFVSLLSMTL